MQITINVPDDLPMAFIQKEIHHFEERLKKVNVPLEDISNNDDLKIDAKACLAAYKKIQRGDKTGLSEIGNIDEYIENLKNEN